MNYRHIYHAGNFADVLKHIVVARIVDYLKRKEKAFRVIDTHAGVGTYDLSSDEAQKTGEWRAGVGKLEGAALPGDVAELLSPWLDVVRSLNAGNAVRRYPGSPALIRHLLRKQDRLTAIELHPKDAALLQGLFAGDYQVRVIELDGWLALNAQVPPKEKRGLVLVDPPFEEPGDFNRLIDGLIKAHRRWPGGTYALWYPIKDRRTVETYRTALRKCAIPRILDVSVKIRAPSSELRLDGCGMTLVNPPHVFEAEAHIWLPFVGAALSEDGVNRAELRRLAGEPKHA